jgi:hypothetical protein
MALGMQIEINLIKRIILFHLPPVGKMSTMCYGIAFTRGAF